jgi:hypothetical protein
VSPDLVSEPVEAYAEAHTTPAAAHLQALGNIGGAISGAVRPATPPPPPPAT